jgi:hypothetical protein
MQSFLKHNPSRLALALPEFACPEFTCPEFACPEFTCPDFTEGSKGRRAKKS